MRTLSLIFIVVVLFIVGYFLFQKFSTKPLTPFTGPLETIRIGNIGEYSIFNLIAQDKGFFRNNGLEAGIHEYESGPPAVAALLSGQEDVAIAADFVGVMNIFSNPHLRILSQVSSQKVFYLVARHDKGITIISDIKGKKIGVTRKSAGEFYLGQLLILNHLNLKDITIIDLPPSQIVSQIKTGQIDAAVIFDPYPYTLARELGNQVIVWPAQGDQKIFALSYSTDTFIANHPQVILRYLRSLIQAEHYVQAYPLEAQQLIAKKLGYDNTYMQHMWKNFTFTNGLDQELLLSMEAQARWAITSGITDKQTVPNYLNFISFDGLEASKPEAITIIH